MNEQLKLLNGDILNLHCWVAVLVLASDVPIAIKGLAAFTGLMAGVRLVIHIVGHYSGK